MKKTQNRTKLIGDITVVVIILAVAAICFYFTRPRNNESSEIIASIYKNGKEYKVIILNKIESGYDLDLEDAVIRVEPGKIRCLYSTCPEQYCVNAGWLENPGESAVCVPLGIAVILNSEVTLKETGGGNEIDAVAG